MRKLNRIPLPLMLALAVVIGVSVVIVIQINVLPYPPAIVAPIETSATAQTSGSSTYSFSVDVSPGAYAVYATLAGLGKLQIQTNTTGWYYLQNDWIVTMVRRSSGTAEFTLSNGQKVYVKEINDTHALVLNEANSVVVVTQKIQVGNTGWIVYHPVPTAYDTNTVNAMKSVMTTLVLTQLYVFQPKRDYVTYDPNSKTYTVYCDTIDNGGSVSYKAYKFTNSTSFVPLQANSPITVNAIEQIDTYNYVLFPIWMLLYYQASSSTKTALTITPAQ